VRTTFAVNNTSRWVASLALGIGLAGAMDASAQGGGPREGKPWSVSLSLSGEYDDNIFTTKTDKQSSFKAIVSPEAHFAHALPQTYFSGRYRYSMLYFENRAKLNHQHIVDLNLSHSFNPRLRLDIKDTFRYGQEPQIVEGATVVQRRGDFFNNFAQAALAIEMTRKVQLHLAADLDRWDYKDPANDTALSRYNYGASAGVRYVVLPTTWVGANYRFSRSDFDNPHPSGISRDADSHFFFASLSHLALPTLMMNVNFGAEYREFDAGGAAGIKKSVTSPYVDASVTYNYYYASAATLGFRYSLQPTELQNFLSAETAYIYSRIGHQLTGKLSLNIDGIIILQTLPGDQNLTGPGPDRDEEVYIAGVGFTYAWNKFLSTNIGWTFTKLDSELSGRGFTRNQATVGMRFTY
jgi:hypothetical protein